MSSALQAYVAAHPGGVGATQAGYVAAINQDAAGGDSTLTSVWNWIWSGQAARDAADSITAPIAGIGAGVQDDIRQAAALATTIVNAVKWTGIAIAIVVGVVILLIGIAVLFQARWAVSVLGPLAPEIARGAVKGAVGA